MRYWLALGFVPETKQLLALARAAEELGFFGVTLADHLAMHLHTELAPDHGERRLPGPEAVESRGAAQGLQARGHFRSDPFRRNLHLHAAAQIAQTLDGNLHVNLLA